MDGQLIQKKDCSAAVQAAMPEAKSLAQVCVGGVIIRRQQTYIPRPRGLGLGCVHCKTPTPPTDPRNSFNPSLNQNQAGKLAEAVELLMGVEKQARMGNDVPSLKEVCLFAVRLVRCAFGFWLD